MSAFRHGLSILALIATLLLPPAVFAQLPGGLSGAGAAGPGGAAADLSCAGRGADGKLGCGDIGLEETLDLCEDKDGDYICDDQDQCPDTPKDTPVFINGCHMVELKEDQPLVLRGVNFEFNEATLTSDSTPILDQAVGVLNTQPDILVSIDGHTDSLGSDAYNRRLSRDRARAVYRYFIDAGVKEDRLIYRGFGESQPVAPNTLEDGSDNPAGRAQNRRVELNIVDEETFTAIQREIEAEEARLEAERRAAAAAAASKAEEERRAAQEQEAAADSATDDEEVSEEQEATTEEFDESEYLQYLGEEEGEGDSGTTEAATAPGAETDTPGDEGGLDETAPDGEAPAEADSGEEGAREADAADSDEGADSEFDESEYLEFLNEETSDESGQSEASEPASPGSDSNDESSESDSESSPRSDDESDNGDSDYTLEVQPAETR